MLRTFRTHLDRDNQNAVDAQIVVLNGMSRDGLTIRYHGTLNYEAALRAYEWRAEGITEAPSVYWMKVLAEK